MELKLTKKELIELAEKEQLGKNPLVDMILYTNSPEEGEIPQLYVDTVENLIYALDHLDDTEPFKVTKEKHYNNEDYCCGVYETTYWVNMD